MENEHEVRTLLEWFIWKNYLDQTQEAFLFGGNGIYFAHF